MAHNVLAAIAFDLDALLSQQTLTVQGATQTRERLTRQETVVLVARYVLTISEMAQQAADDVRAFQAQIIDAADQAANQQTPKLTPLDQLQDDQDKINQQIEELIEALVAEANPLDLLDEEQLERARDTDASIAMIQETAAAMKEALDEAADSSDPEDQASELGRGLAVKSINRDDGKDWGMLRDKAAEDTVKGTREAVAAEYREGVEAYFRVLAERARQNP